MSKDEYACHTLASAKAEVRALLLDFKLVLDRTDGYGMKIQKYHQQIHGPANIDYFGSPKNVDGRPCEKNMKSHAKAPGRTTQKRGNTFHNQCESQMFDTMVIQQALIDHLDEELTTIQEFQLSKTLSSTIYGKSVGGSQFIVGLQGSEVNAGKWIVVVRNPKFSEEVPALLDDVVGFIAKYIAKYCDGKSVVVWSDHRRDGMIFCGHPKYRSGEAWNDWAMIKWQTTETGKDGLSDRKSTRLNSSHVD